MRNIEGTLAFEYSANDSHVVLEGDNGVYIFDKGLQFEESIQPGTFVSLTLITVPGPNPANTAKAMFDVERIAAIEVLRTAAPMARPEQDTASQVAMRM